MTLYYRRGWRAAGFALLSAMIGLAAAYAWRQGHWGLLAGTALTGVWLAGLAWWNAARVPQPVPEREEEAGDDSVFMQGLLLDAAPTPLVSVAGGLEDGGQVHGGPGDAAARALNRAARMVFGTDDRILPAPGALLDPASRYLRHEGRMWRIDRVAAPGGLTLAALIDVEQEERAAEARASAELIEVLGHELLNGLAPIVSLAESAQDAATRRPIDPAFLDEILGPLARRADGLLRFATAYRALARLPEPRQSPVPLGEFA